MNWYDSIEIRTDMGYLPRIPLIKVVRAIFGLSLLDSKRLVDEFEAACKAKPMSEHFVRTRLATALAENDSEGITKWAQKLLDLGNAI